MSITVRPTLAGVVLGLFVFAAAAYADGELRCQAGRADDYDATESDEYAFPSDALTATMTQLPDNHPPYLFDRCSRNFAFAHTFTGCALDSAVETLHLTVRVKGTPSGENNSDRILLGSGGTIRWGVHLNVLQSIQTGGADPFWSSADSATFVLDLGNLPPSDSPPSGWPTWPVGVTSVLGYVAEGGDLDVVIHDDSCVDFLQLTVSSPTPTLPSTWGSLKGRYR